LKSDHFLLTTLGSLGDLHPYIAVGIGLRERGHTVTIATSEIYRAKVEGEGLRFAPLRPDMTRLIDNPEVMRRLMDPRRGTEYVIRELFLPWLEQTFEDTVAAARDADLIAGHAIAFATSTVAEHLKKPWVSVALQPSLFMSVYDPPVISGAPLLTALISAGPGVTRLFFRLLIQVANRWNAPLNTLRRRLGLPEIRNVPIWAMFSRWGTQAWFSRVLAGPQTDWPEATTITGFPFYDKFEPGQGLSAGLRTFLEAGGPPVVFTLGSSAVFDAGGFYEESIAAVSKNGRRAVLLIGRDPRNVPRQLPSNVFTAEYAPYSELLPRAAATVHQGGVGTTAQAMRAGRPMIVVPWSHDQPDNARRVKKLGVAGVIPRKAYRADRLNRELELLFSNGASAASAQSVAEEMHREDGVAAACEGLESILSASRRQSRLPV
jgi:UDP:flavonoid glycosyltransferase YjiC (YdhE family)